MANSKRSLHVKTGDRVIVTAGKDKGKQGNIKKSIPTEGKVVVEEYLESVKTVELKVNITSGSIGRTIYIRNGRLKKVKIKDE